MEHVAHTESLRFSLTAYHPQRRVRVWPKGVTEPLLLAVPLIRGHVFVLLAQARDRALYYAAASSAIAIS